MKKARNNKESTAWAFMFLRPMSTCKKKKRLINAIYLTFICMISPFHFCFLSSSFTNVLTTHPLTLTLHFDTIR